MPEELHSCRLKKAIWITAGFAVILILDIVDYLTGPTVAFSLFYLVPVSSCAWFVGPVTGIVMSVTSSVSWFAAEYLSGRVTAQSDIYHYWEALTRLIFFVIVSLLLAQVRKNLIKESHLARTDNLTGAANFRHFIELLHMETARFDRYGQAFTVVYIDLDNFKVINDTHGHGEGDRALKTVAAVMKEELRETDTAARLGGDEFALLMPETGQEKAKNIIERLQQRLLFMMKLNSWPVTFSIGVLTCTTTPPSVKDLINAADSLMYSVKNRGKNAISFSLYSDNTEKNIE